MKKVIWLGNSRQRIKSFPEATKDIAGRELFRVQAGEAPTDWRAMSDVGLGVIEIRVHRPREHRIFYIANYPEAVYVLHAFQKKTQATSEADKQMGKIQYGELQRLRKKSQKKQK